MTDALVPNEEQCSRKGCKYKRSGRADFCCKRCAEGGGHGKKCDKELVEELVMGPVESHAVSPGILAPVAATPTVDSLIMSIPTFQQIQHMSLEEIKMCQKTLNKKQTEVLRDSNSATGADRQHLEEQAESLDLAIENLGIMRGLLGAQSAALRTVFTSWLAQIHEGTMRLAEVAIMNWIDRCVEEE